MTADHKKKLQDLKQSLESDFEGKLSASEAELQNANQEASELK